MIENALKYNEKTLDTEENSFKKGGMKHDAIAITIKEETGSKVCRAASAK